ncbi:MAG TPA: molybdenum cofactor guanylyltransferase MobA [Ramlibacter sp.]
MIAQGDITGVVLAGGRGSRMGGVDKGLQVFNGMPLAFATLVRLQPQVGHVMINANRNLGAYESFGVPVWPDVLPDYAGPLAGFLTALEQCETPWLVTVPCDTPLFPQDLVERLAQAAQEQDAEIAMAAAREEDGQIRTQPVFSLMRVELLESLVKFTADGGRKIDKWTAQHRTAVVPFDRAGDPPRAFFNANTLAELHELEKP